MSETKRIADQLLRSQTGSAWHGHAVSELLTAVNGAMARRRPLPLAHSMWEIVLHITAWQAATLCAVKGQKMPSLAESQDWPWAGQTEQDWHNAVQELGRVNQELVAAITHFPDDRLGGRVPGREYTFYDLLHGVVQHNLYHAGQMALLKKTSG